MASSLHIPFGVEVWYWWNVLEFLGKQELQLISTVWTFQRRSKTIPGQEVPILPLFLLLPCFYVKQQSGKEKRSGLSSGVLPLEVRLSEKKEGRCCEGSAALAACPFSQVSLALCLYCSYLECSSLPGMLGFLSHAGADSPLLPDDPCVDGMLLCAHVGSCWSWGEISLLSD